MIVDQDLVNFINALIIDDEREITTMKVMSTLGNNSSRYWSVIKDADTKPINTLKDKYGKLAKTIQGTLNAALDYFPNLFKAKDGTNPAVRTLQGT